MSVYVFTGPTLARADAESALDAVFLPPVAQGDVIRVAARHPKAIGIIDGYFERVPAVWHKEILWAITEGILVFGSASMGALRAAELAAFGMHGVGRIFELYRDGELEDDDEVTIIHASAEHNFVQLSEAMVNIRFTLERAERERVLDHGAHQKIERIAKSLYYPTRTYAAVTEAALSAGVAASTIEKLRAWLPEGSVDQEKRADAIEMLHSMSEHLRCGSSPTKSTFWFEHTEWWDHAKRTAGALHIGATGDARVVERERILDETRLAHDLYPLVQRDATIRTLALKEGRRAAAAANDETVRVTEAELARKHRLAVQGDVERWCAENDVPDRRFGQLVSEEALVRWVQRAFADEIATRSLDCLRLSGDYASLSERAHAKATTLEELGLEEAGLQEAQIDMDELLRWWSCERRGEAMPPDPTEYALRLGFRDYEAFERALVREFLFSRLTQPEGTTDRLFAV